jgi:hypothetical protein
LSSSTMRAMYWVILVCRRWGLGLGQARRVWSSEWRVLVGWRAT